jgi:hypothetical protein
MSTTPTHWSLRVLAVLTLLMMACGSPSDGASGDGGVKSTGDGGILHDSAAQMDASNGEEAGPNAVEITTTSLPVGDLNAAYSSTLAAVGGHTPYAWSLTAGTLPAGLALSTAGAISGTPTTAGTSMFTVKVADASTPSLTATAALSISISRVWYIRQDGGTNTQCTGLTNAPYTGSGTAQACALNHPFQMLNYQGHWASMAAGDTIQFADPPTNTTPYYIGEQNGALGMDWQPQLGGICPGPNSPASMGASCVLPPLLSGTTIRGQNYGSCHTADHTGLVHPTILSGINGVFAVLQVGGTSDVTISCIEVTQPDTCTSAGTGQGPGQCTSTSNYVDYAGLMLAYQTAQGPANMTLTDFAVVGTQSRGIMGSHLNLLSTDTFTASDIYLIGNGQAGWDGDGGGCNNSCESVGTMNISYADIEWNGCMAVKPYDIGISPQTAPNAFDYCYGQNTSGYGDGFVQIAAGSLNLNVTHSMFKYNTQDGFDGAHLSDDPTTSPKTNISSSWSEGNAGQTFKIGAGASSTGINNVSISNCHILSQASSFPNNPIGWNALDGGDTCRANGDEWALTLRPNASITLENNTSVGYGTVMYDIECSSFFPNCDGGAVVFTNNISVGYPDPANSGQLAAGFYFGSGVSNTVATASNNVWSTMHTGCPDADLPGEIHYVCADPLLVSESNIDAVNPRLTSASPAIGAGVAIPGITTDYGGVTRPNPPAIGAFEP